MSRIYFAGPLFNAGEQSFNERITDILENAGYDVFLPQRDGIVAASLVGKTADEIADMVFKKDVGEVRNSDILLFVLDGRVPDEGACVELGIAYALGKRCYGIRTDVRAFELNMPINLMLSECFEKIFDNPDEDALIDEFCEYLKRNKL